LHASYKRVAACFLLDDAATPISPSYFIHYACCCRRYAAIYAICYFAADTGVTLIYEMALRVATLPRHYAGCYAALIRDAALLLLLFYAYFIFHATLRRFSCHYAAIRWRLPLLLLMPPLI